MRRHCPSALRNANSCNGSIFTPLQDSMATISGRSSSRSLVLLNDTSAMRSCSSLTTSSHSITRGFSPQILLQSQSRSYVYSSSSLLLAPSKKGAKRANSSGKVRTDRSGSSNSRNNANKREANISSTSKQGNPMAKSSATTIDSQRARMDRGEGAMREVAAVVEGEAVVRAATFLSTTSVIKGSNGGGRFVGASASTAASRERPLSGRSDGHADVAIKEQNTQKEKHVSTGRAPSGQRREERGRPDRTEKQRDRGGRNTPNNREPTRRDLRSSDQKWRVVEKEKTQRRDNRGYHSSSSARRFTDATSSKRVMDSKLGSAFGSVVEPTAPTPSRWEDETFEEEASSAVSHTSSVDATEENPTLEKTTKASAVIDDSETAQTEAVGNNSEGNHQSRHSDITKDSTSDRRGAGDFGGEVEDKSALSQAKRDEKGSYSSSSEELSSYSTNDTQRVSPIASSQATAMDAPSSSSAPTLTSSKKSRFAKVTADDNYSATFPSVAAHSHTTSRSHWDERQEGRNDSHKAGSARFGRVVLRTDAFATATAPPPRSRSVVNIAASTVFTSADAHTATVKGTVMMNSTASGRSETVPNTTTNSDKENGSVDTPPSTKELNDTAHADDTIPSGDARGHGLANAHAQAAPHSASQTLAVVTATRLHYGVIIGGNGGGGGSSSSISADSAGESSPIATTPLPQLINFCSTMRSQYKTHRKQEVLDHCLHQLAGYFVHVISPRLTIKELVEADAGGASHSPQKTSPSLSRKLRDDLSQEEDEIPVASSSSIKGLGEEEKPTDHSGVGAGANASKRSGTLRESSSVVFEGSWKVGDNGRRISQSLLLQPPSGAATASSLSSSLGTASVVRPSCLATWLPISAISYGAQANAIATKRFGAGERGVGGAAEYDKLVAAALRQLASSSASQDTETMEDYSSTRSLTSDSGVSIDWSDPSVLSSSPIVALAAEAIDASLKELGPPSSAARLLNHIVYFYNNWIDSEAIAAAKSLHAITNQTSLPSSAATSHVVKVNAQSTTEFAGTILSRDALFGTSTPPTIAVVSPSDWGERCNTAHDSAASSSSSSSAVAALCPPLVAACFKQMYRSSLMRQEREDKKLLAAEQAPAQHAAAAVGSSSDKKRQTTQLRTSNGESRRITNTATTTATTNKPSSSSSFYPSPPQSLLESEATKVRFHNVGIALLWINLLTKYLALNAPSLDLVGTSLTLLSLSSGSLRVPHMAAQYFPRFVVPLALSNDTASREWRQSGKITARKGQHQLSSSSSSTGAGAGPSKHFRTANATPITNAAIAAANNDEAALERMRAAMKPPAEINVGAGGERGQAAITTIEIEEDEEDLARGSIHTNTASKVELIAIASSTVKLLAAYPELSATTLNSPPNAADANNDNGNSSSNPIARGDGDAVAKLSGDGDGDIAVSNRESAPFGSNSFHRRRHVRIAAYNMNRPPEERLPNPIARLFNHWSPMLHTALYVKHALVPNLAELKAQPNDVLPILMLLHNYNVLSNLFKREVFARNLADMLTLSGPRVSRPAPSTAFKAQVISILGETLRADWRKALLLDDADGEKGVAVGGESDDAGLHSKTEAAVAADEEGDRILEGTVGRNGRSRLVLQELHNGTRGETDEDGQSDHPPPPASSLPLSLLKRSNGLRGKGDTKKGICDSVTNQNELAQLFTPYLWVAAIDQSRTIFAQSSATSKIQTLMRGVGVTNAIPSSKDGSISSSIFTSSAGTLEVEGVGGPREGGLIVGGGAGRNSQVSLIRNAVEIIHDKNSKNSSRPYEQAGADSESAPAVSLLVIHDATTAESLVSLCGRRLSCISLLAGYLLSPATADRIGIDAFSVHTNTIQQWTLALLDDMAAVSEVLNRSIHVAAGQTSGEVLRSNAQRSYDYEEEDEISSREEKKKTTTSAHLIRHQLRRLIDLRNEVIGLTRLRTDDCFDWSLPLASRPSATPSFVTSPNLRPLLTVGTKHAPQIAEKLAKLPLTVSIAQWLSKRTADTTASKIEATPSQPLVEEGGAITATTPKDGASQGPAVDGGSSSTVTTAKAVEKAAKAKSGNDELGSGSDAAVSDNLASAESSGTKGTPTTNTVNININSTTARRSLEELSHALHEHILNLPLGCIPRYEHRSASSNAANSASAPLSSEAGGARGSGAQQPPSESVVVLSAPRPRPLSREASQELSSLIGRSLAALRKKLVKAAQTLEQRENSGHSDSGSTSCQKETATLEVDESKTTEAKFATTVETAARRDGEVPAKKEDGSYGVSNNNTNATTTPNPTDEVLTAKALQAVLASLHALCLHGPQGFNTIASRWTKGPQHHTENTKSQKQPAMPSSSNAMTQKAEDANGSATTTEPNGSSSSSPSTSSADECPQRRAVNFAVHYYHKKGELSLESCLSALMLKIITPEEASAMIRSRFEFFGSRNNDNNCTVDNTTAENSSISNARDAATITTTTTTEDNAAKKKDTTSDNSGEKKEHSHDLLMAPLTEFHNTIFRMLITDVIPPTSLQPGLGVGEGKKGEEVTPESGTNANKADSSPSAAAAVYLNLNMLQDAMARAAFELRAEEDTMAVPLVQSSDTNNGNNNTNTTEKISNNSSNSSSSALDGEESLSSSGAGGPEDIADKESSLNETHNNKMKDEREDDKSVSTSVAIIPPLPPSVSITAYRILCALSVELSAVKSRFALLSRPLEGGESNSTNSAVPSAHAPPSSSSTSIPPILTKPSSALDDRLRFAVFYDDHNGLGLSLPAVKPDRQLVGSGAYVVSHLYASYAHNGWYLEREQWIREWLVAHHHRGLPSSSLSLSSSVSDTTRALVNEVTDKLVAHTSAFSGLKKDSDGDSNTCNNNNVSDMPSPLIGLQSLLLVESPHLLDKYLDADTIVVLEEHEEAVVTNAGTNHIEGEKTAPPLTTLRTAEGGGDRDEEEKDPSPPTNDSSSPGRPLTVPHSSSSFSKYSIDTIHELADAVIFEDRHAHSSNLAFNAAVCARTLQAGYDRLLLWVASTASILDTKWDLRDKKLRFVSGSGSGGGGNNNNGNSGGNGGKAESHLPRPLPPSCEVTSPAAVYDHNNLDVLLRLTTDIFLSRSSCNVGVFKRVTHAISMLNKQGAPVDVGMSLVVAANRLYSDRKIREVNCGVYDFAISCSLHPSTYFGVVMVINAFCGEDLTKGMLRHVFRTITIAGQNELITSQQRSRVVELAKGTLVSDCLDLQCAALRAMASANCGASSIFYQLSAVVLERKCELTTSQFGDLLACAPCLESADNLLCPALRPELIRRISEDTFSWAEVSAFLSYFSAAYIGDAALWQVVINRYERVVASSPTATMTKRSSDDDDDHAEEEEEADTEDTNEEDEDEKQSSSSSHRHSMVIKINLETVPIQLKAALCEAACAHLLPNH